MGVGKLLAPQPAVAQQSDPARAQQFGSSRCADKGIARQVLCSGCVGVMRIAVGYAGVRAHRPADR